MVAGTEEVVDGTEELLDDTEVEPVEDAAGTCCCVVWEEVLLQDVDVDVESVEVCEDVMFGVEVDIFSKSLIVFLSPKVFYWEINIFVVLKFLFREYEVVLYIISVMTLINNKMDN